MSNETRDGGPVHLASAVRELLAVLDAHEVDTLDCDRAGVAHCDCLQRARKKVDAMLATESEDAQNDRLQRPCAAGENDGH